MNKAKALTAYLAERQPAPFDWRAANCTHFAARFVELVEQREILARYPMPASLAGARRKQRQAGGLQAIVTAQLSREPIAPALAQLGDVVLLPLNAADPDAQALGLCCGEQAALVVEDGTVALVPMSLALSAWRVAA